MIFVNENDDEKRRDTISHMISIRALERWLNTPARQKWHQREIRRRFRQTCHREMTGL